MYILLGPLLCFIFHLILDGLVLQAERFAEIVSVIETGQPDFVCLQEVIHPLLKLLKGITSSFTATSIAYFCSYFEA